jgi:hypothetical protein
MNKITMSQLSLVFHLIIAEIQGNPVRLLSRVEQRSRSMLYYIDS